MKYYKYAMFLTFIAMSTILKSMEERPITSLNPAYKSDATLYHQLKINANSSIQNVEKAFKTICQENAEKNNIHPEEQDKVIEAYSILNSPIWKKLYDSKCYDLQSFYAEVRSQYEGETLNLYGLVGSSKETTPKQLATNYLLLTYRKPYKVFEEIRDAYVLLSDPAIRDIYDDNNDKFHFVIGLTKHHALKKWQEYTAVKEKVSSTRKSPPFKKKRTEKLKNEESPKKRRSTGFMKPLNGAFETFKNGRGGSLRQTLSPGLTKKHLPLTSGEESKDQKSDTNLEQISSTVQSDPLERRQKKDHAKRRSVTDALIGQLQETIVQKGSYRLSMSPEIMKKIEGSINQETHEKEH